MRFIVGVASMVVATAVGAAVPGDPAPMTFAHRLPLTVEGNEGLYRLELPTVVYQGVVQADLSDLRVANGADEAVPFAFVPSAASGSQASPTRSLKVLAVDRRSTENVETPSDYLFDLNGRFAIERVRITVDVSNTLAPVEVFSRTRPSDPWRLIATTVLYRLTRDGLEHTSPALDIATNRDRFWLVRVDARGGGLGSARPAIEVSWSPQSIVFVPRGAAPYALVFGHHEASGGALPLATVVPGYREGVVLQLPEARVADRVSDSAPAAIVPPALPPLPRNKKAWALWAVLMVGLSVLAWMAWRLARELGATNSVKGRSEEARP